MLPSCLTFQCRGATRAHGPHFVTEARVLRPFLKPAKQEIRKKYEKRALISYCANDLSLITSRESMQKNQTLEVIRRTHPRPLLDWMKNGVMQVTAYLGSCGRQWRNSSSLKKSDTNGYNVLDMLGPADEYPPQQLRKLDNHTQNFWTTDGLGIYGK